MLLLEEDNPDGQERHEASESMSDKKFGDVALIRAIEDKAQGLHSKTS